MAIKQIRELPRELPHALLFLDDIEEICRILTEAYATAVEASRARFAFVADEAKGAVEKVVAKAVYHIGNLRMDSIGDLIEYGRPATSFKLRITLEGDEDRHGPEFEIYSFLNPRLQLYALKDDALWSVFGQVTKLNSMATAP